MNHAITEKLPAICSRAEPLPQKASTMKDECKSEIEALPTMDKLKSGKAFVTNVA